MVAWSRNRRRFSSFQQRSQGSKASCKTRCLSGCRAMSTWTFTSRRNPRMLRPLSSAAVSFGEGYFPSGPDEAGEQNTSMPHMLHSSVIEVTVQQGPLPLMHTASRRPCHPRPPVLSGIQRGGGGWNRHSSHRLRKHAAQL